MKRELELKDIAGYLPYNLNLYVSHDLSKSVFMSGFNPFLRSINSMDVRRRKYVIEGAIGVNMDEYKIILRPFSDLYKTIQHKGKEIIPIVELARINCPHLDWKFDENRDCAIEYGESRITFVFDFDGYFTMVAEYDKTAQMPNQFMPVVNQCQLFDFLHELKIDYRGLIYAGLAVDANTLDVNPYK